MATFRPVMRRLLSRPMWLLGVAGLATIAAWAASIELSQPRYSLPQRFWFGPLDEFEWSAGFLPDFTRCIRASVSPEEARAFVENYFKAGEIGALPLDDRPLSACNGRWCPAEPVPPPMAYAPNGDGSVGAIYKDGVLYWWSYNM